MDVKSYVNVMVEGETEVKRYMVVKGLKGNVGTDKFTANGISPNSKITVEKKK